MSSPPHIPPGPPDDASRADIGLVCALPLESAAFLKRCEHVRKYTGGRFVFRGGRLGAIRVAVVETGPGAKLAARGTQALIDAHHPTWVISAGFSGALRPELKLGDIVVGTGIHTTDGRQLSLDLRYEPDPARGVHSGWLVNSDRIVRTVVEKKQLAESTSGLAVDMESFAVADACRTAGQKFLAIRAISDDLSKDLPAEAIAIFAANGYKRWGVVAGSLWNRPSSATDLWQLREQAATAADSLAAFLPEILEQLIPPGTAATTEGR